MKILSKSNILYTKKKVRSRIIDITVCIACHPPYLSKLQTLLKSINNSSLLPSECIIGLSETNENLAIKIEKELNSKFDFNIRITSSVNKCNQADNRNRAINLSKTKYITICDSDDIVHKHRLEILYKKMESTNCLSLLHGFKYPNYVEKKISKYIFFNNWNLNKKAKIYDGIYLYDKMKETDGKTIHLPLYCHHAYITFQKKIFEEVKQNTSDYFYRAEDSQFVRDILKYFGRNKNTMCFYDIPLVKYF